MKKRVLYIALLFVSFMALFAIQKPIFMLYNEAFGSADGSDYLRVMMHGLKLDSTVTGYFTVLPLLLVLATIFFPKMNLRRILAPYYIFVAAFVALVFVVDVGLYAFWQFKLDSMVFFYLDSPQEAMASVSWWFILIRFLGVLIIAFGVYRLLRFITPREMPEVRNKWVASLVVIALVGVNFIAVRGGVTESTSNVGRAYFSKNQFLNHSAVNPVFSLLYSLGKSENFAAQFDTFPEAERAKLYEGLFPKDGETIVELLNTKRPNVLIIQLESFTRNLMASLGGEPDVTPQLDRLSKEGIMFKNCYAGSFRSDRGTVCTFSGYLGQPTASIMKIVSKSRTLPSIANSLSQVGYATDFMYGGDINFTNMQSYFRSTGYQRITSDTDFTSAEQKTHAWGVTDDIVMDRLYDQITTRTDTPWHTGLFTLSSHNPFVVPYDRLEDPITNAFAYTDHSLGEFVDRLKASPAWKDLLIVIVSDHGYAYPQSVLYNDPVAFHIPMIWLGGAVKQPMVVDEIVSQTDLAATLLGQMELPHDDFRFSRDVFSSSYTYPFAFSSYNNGFIFRDSTGVSVYANESDMVVSESPTPSQTRINRGKVILQTLYDDLGER